MDFRGLLAESLDGTNAPNSRRTRRRPRNNNNTSGTTTSTNHANTSLLDPITSVHITTTPLTSSNTPVNLEDIKSSSFSSLFSQFRNEPFQNQQHSQNQPFQNQQQSQNQSQFQNQNQPFQAPLQPLEFDYIGEQPATISARRFIISSSTSDALDDILRSALFQNPPQFQNHANLQQPHQQQQQSYQHFNFMPTTTTPVTQGINLIKLADLPVRLVKTHEKAELCPICHESFQVDPFVNELPCGHVFHMDCIMKWLKDQNTCPFCRYKL